METPDPEVILPSKDRTVATRHDVNFHGYADDTQLYVHCRPEEIAATSAKLERCITAMHGILDVCEQA